MPKNYFHHISEICSRLQTARPAVIKCMLYYLVPWLFNMELVDANLGVVVSEAAVASDAEKISGGVDEVRAATATAAAAVEKGNTSGGREGWGTAEATEMIMNNLFYITVKVKFSIQASHRYDVKSLVNPCVTENLINLYTEFGKRMTHRIWIRGQHWAALATAAQHFPLFNFQ